MFMMGALELGAKVELYYLDAPDFDKLWERVERRTLELPSKIFEMTVDDLRSACNIFQPPDLAEIAFYDQGSIIPWDYELTENEDAIDSTAGISGHWIGSYVQVLEFETGSWLFDVEKNTFPI